MEINKHWKMLSIILILISLSGCSMIPYRAFVFEPPQYFKIAARTEICTKKLTDKEPVYGEDPKYCYVTERAGAFYDSKAGAALFAAKQRSK